MRKLSLLGKAHHGAHHTLRERSTGEHLRSWIGVGMVWGALFGLLAPVADGGLAASQGYLVATLIHTLAGAATLSALAAAVGALTRPGRDGSAPQGTGALHEQDGFRLVIRGSAEDHALARRLLDTNSTSAVQVAAAVDIAAETSVPVDRTVQPAPGASVHQFQPSSRSAPRHPVGVPAPDQAPARQHTQRERLTA